MEEDRLSGVYYFINKDGIKPVKEFINSLTKREQAKVYAYICELKKQGNNLRRPMADYLRDGIYELRPKDNRIFYFFYLRNIVVLVHAIRKRTRSIAEDELELCIRRKIKTQEWGNNIEKIEL
jgi:phage-related protein